MNFTIQRPIGSVNLSVPWRSKDRRTYWPQWRRPDGNVAGVLWTIDAPHERVLVFDGAVEFYNMYGERFLPKSPSKGRYVVKVTASPIYFINRQLISIE